MWSASNSQSRVALVGVKPFSYYVFEIIAYYDQHEFGRNQRGERRSSSISPLFLFIAYVKEKV
jgi:hypothetical protein